jgi:excisionase family DNA binding protein
MNREAINTARGQSRDEWLLSPEDVAAILGVPKSTLYAWRYRGEGPPSLRVGKHIRYRREDVREWIERQTTPRKAS